MKASSPNEREKNKFLTLYLGYTLFLDSFCVLIVMLQC